MRTCGVDAGTIGHFDAVERQGVGERDPLVGALGRLDAGEAGDGDRVPLGQRAESRHRLRRAQQPAGGLGDAARDRLLRDVDHAGAAVLVEMGEVEESGGFVDMSGQAQETSRAAGEC